MNPKRLKRNEVRVLKRLSLSLPLLSIEIKYLGTFKLDKSGKFSSIGKVLDFNFNLISLSNEILFLEDHRFTFH